MKHFTASQARQHLSNVLDVAERGESVIIERRGLRFVIKSEKLKPAQRSRRRKSALEFVDPALDSGNWQWNWSAGAGIALSTDQS